MKYVVFRRGCVGRIPTVQTYTRKGELWDIFSEACENSDLDVAVSVKIWTADGKLVVDI